MTSLDFTGKGVVFKYQEHRRLTRNRRQWVPVTKIRLIGL